MWIAIVGPPGSCKHAVAKRLSKDLGYVVEGGMPAVAMRAEPPMLEVWGGTPFDVQLFTMGERYTLSRDIQKRAGEEDILQIGTFWDTHRAYTPALVAREKLTEQEALRLGLVHSLLETTLDAPHVVLSLRADQMRTSERLDLGSQKIPEEDLVAVTAAFATYLPEIRVLVIDVEVKEDFEETIEEAKAGIESARARGSMAHSLWMRRFMK